MSDAILGAPSTFALHRAQGSTAPSLEEAAKSFEGFLLGSMLRHGSRPLGGSHPLDGGSAGRTYRELLLEELARMAAQRQGLGLARAIAEGVRDATGEGEAR